MCREKALPVEALFAALYGILIARRVGPGVVEIATADRGGLAGIRIVSVWIAPDARVFDVAAGAHHRHLAIDPSADDVIATLDAQIAARRHAALEIVVGAGPSSFAGDIKFPIHCAVHIEGDDARASLRRGRQVDPRLGLGMLDELVAAVDVVADSPSLTVTQLVGRLPLAYFELILAADYNAGALVPVVEEWADLIGLPVYTRTTTLAPGSLPDLPSLPGDHVPGAVVVLPGHGARPATPSDQPVGSHVLPNGMPIFDLNANETRETYQEIFVRRAYLQGGLSLTSGDTIIDVGGNIGLFALFAHLEAEGVTIHVVEPVAELAALARRNISLHGVDATVHQAALGASRGRERFVYYPQSSLQSGLHADRVADREVVVEYIRNQAAVSGDSGIEPLTEDDLTTLLLDRFQGQEREVEVRTLASLIDDLGISDVGLLKVDVERAEEEVLLGLRDEHWPRIRQVVAEVHDVGGRLGRVIALLEGHGFWVMTRQDRLFAGTELFLVYARRGPASEDSVATAAALWVSDQRGLPVLAGVRHSDDPAPGVQSFKLPWPDDHAALDENAAPLALAQAGTAVMRAVSALVQPPTKMIVVDADNTLWGGVCGEIGPQNVQVGGVYREVQQFLKAQRRMGRLLCLVSKNNEADVRAVFRNHPGMPLSMDDFAALAISWESKAENVADLAGRLGVSLASVIFIDDSGAERSEVRTRLPQVTVVELPADVAGFPAALRETWALDDVATTREDRLRAAFTGQENQRLSVAATARSFADYLSQLELVMDVQPSGQMDVGRISQLSMRTNQFNFALRRHTQPAVLNLLAQSDLALSVRLRDRFGDYGLIGFVAAVTAAGDVLNVTDLFISCRALGRNVEWHLLRAIGAAALDRGLVSVVLPARRGERNQPALAFLDGLMSACGGQRSADGQAICSAARLASIDWRTAGQAAPAAPPTRHVTADAPPRTYKWPAPATLTQDAVAERLHYARGKRAAWQGPFEPATTVLEREIVAVWSDVLGTERIGLDDDLFGLGGDSMAAVRVCNAVSKRHGRLSLESFLAVPTVRTLVRLIEDSAEVTKAVPARRKLGAVTRASGGQRRLWIADRSAKENAQVIPLAYRISGPLDIDRLEEALAAVVNRHEALRTTLHYQAHDLYQVPLPPPGKFTLGRAEPDDGESARRFFAGRFDLSRDLMIRALIAKEAPDRHLLLLMVHHAAVDGYSVGILQRDLSRAYGLAFGETTNVQPFREYVLRQDDLQPLADRRAEEVAELVRAVPMRNARLSGSARAERPEFYRIAVGTELSDTVAESARLGGTTSFTIFRAACEIVMASWGGERFARLGFSAENRTDADFVETVGFFANIVPMVAQVDANESLGGYLAAASVATRAALGRADVPYSSVLRKLYGEADSHTPPFDILFSYQPSPSHSLWLENCTTRRVDPTFWPVPFPLMLDVEDHPDGAQCLWRYNALVHAPAMIGAMGQAYLAVVRLLCWMPDLRIADATAVCDQIFRRARVRQVSSAVADRHNRLGTLLGQKEAAGG